MAITGINHITFAVRELEPAFQFYVEVLGASPRARWKRGAFLTLGGVWLALLEGDAEPVGEGYSHIAFSVSQEDFESVATKLRESAALWSENQTPGDSIYFCDPDGHRLEVHASTLEARLDALEREQPEDYRRFDVAT